MWVAPDFKATEQYRTLLPPMPPYAGCGRPRIYGQRFNPQQIDAKYRVSTQTHENITTEVYQAKLRHKKFPEPLNVVCILKTQPLREKNHTSYCSVLT